VIRCRKSAVLITAPSRNRDLTHVDAVVPMSWKIARTGKLAGFSRVTHRVVPPAEVRIVPLPNSRQGVSMQSRTMLAAAVLLAGVTVAAAQDPIAERKAAMKANGDQARIGAQMARGEMPFDLAKAQTIFQTYADSATKTKGLFPETTQTGGDTAADPRIWQNMSDFQAKLAKFGQDAAEAKGKVKDEASFKATFSEVQKSCGGCHETYRLKKS